MPLTLQLLPAGLALADREPWIWCYEGPDGGREPVNRVPFSSDAEGSGWSAYAEPERVGAWFHGVWWWDRDLSSDRNVWDLRGPWGGAADVIRSWNAGNGADCPQRAS